MRKTSWRFDRRWGAVCPPTFVFIMMVLAALTTAAFASPTTNTDDDPLNSANPAQEVTATADCDDATMATPVAINNVVVTYLGVDMPAIVDSTAINDSGGLVDETAMARSDNANPMNNTKKMDSAPNPRRTAEETFRGATPPIN